MAKRSKRASKRTSGSQRLVQVFGAVIALSMILVLLAPLAGGLDRSDPTPTPTPQPPEPTATFRPLPTATQPPTPTPDVALAPTPETGG